MGIKNIMQLLKKQAPNSISKAKLIDFQNQQVACDASLTVYQYLFATSRIQGDKLIKLITKEGQQTGHIVGIVNRSLKLMKHGILPVWVYDGKPPELKQNEQNKRKEKRIQDQKQSDHQMSLGNTEQALKIQKRVITVTDEMFKETQQVLSVLGIPFLQAPGEAEAQCAILTQSEHAEAVLSEDLDSLVFGSRLLIRGVGNTKGDVEQIVLQDVLNELQLSQEELIDLSILCGCDYTSTIKNVGVQTSYKLIKQHGNIENILDFLESENIKKGKERYVIPEDFRQSFPEVRTLFSNPNRTDPKNINKFEWKMPDFQEVNEILQQYSYQEKGISQIKKNMENIQKNYQVWK